MVQSAEYPKRKENTVQRYATRAAYDLGLVHSIINSSPCLNVSFVPDAEEPMPIILPMIGAMGSFEYPSADIDEPLDCYIHGHISGRMMKMAGELPNGLPVCVSATKVDGLVLALTPFSHSYNYRSAVLQGHAFPVEAEDEKDYAMSIITNKVLSNRWENSRTPPTPAEFKTTAILKIKVKNGSGKVRTGEPHDDAKDMKDQSVVDKVWVGVIPVHEAYGQPVPCAYNKVAEVPAYMQEFVNDTTASNKQYAVEAATDPKH